MPNTPRWALPAPAGNEPNNIPQDFSDLSTRLDSILYPSYTTAERDALPPADRPPGTVIFNETKNAAEVRNAADTAWLLLSEALQTIVNPGGVEDLDLALANTFDITPDFSPLVLSFVNAPPAGTVAEMTVILRQGGVAHTVTWPGSVVWLNGAAPSLPPNTVTVLTFTSVNGGATWYGVARGVGQFPVSYAAIATMETGTTHNTWGDLPTVGPAVTVTPITGKLKITVGANLGSSYNYGGADMSFQMSGGNVLAPTNGRSVGILTGQNSNPGLRSSKVVYLSGLAPASTVITAKYSGYLGSGALNWFAADRTLLVEHVV